MFKVILILIFLFPVLTFAQKAPSRVTFDWPAQQTWAQQKTDELFAHCKEMSRVKWIKQYEEMENLVFERLDSLSGMVDQIPIDSALADLGELVFPQVLPVDYPGNFLTCDKFFSAYHHAKNAQEGLKQVELLNHCYSEKYRSAKVKIRLRLIECLRALKD